MTPSWWSRPWSATSRMAWRLRKPLCKAMEEISGPVIGIALVLSAVFVPTAFIPGITGRLYQQFAVTIAISVILSAFNALTLSPALAALMLQPKAGEPRAAAALFRLVQSRLRRAPRKAMSVCRERSFARARWPWSCCVGFGLAAGFFSSRVPVELPARRRSGLSCSCISSFPTRLPSNAPTQRAERSRTSWPKCRE